VNGITPSIIVRKRRVADRVNRLALRSTGGDISLAKKNGIAGIASRVGEVRKQVLFLVRLGARA
jgi:hypothetical protein